MKLLPQTFEVISEEEYRYLCNKFRNPLLSITRVEEFKGFFHFFLESSLSDDGYSDDYSIKTIYDTILEYFQFPYVQKTKELDIPEFLRLEMTYRAMALLQSIDRLGKRTYLTDFIYSELNRILDSAESFDNYNILTREDIQERIEEYYLNEFDNQSEEAEGPEFLYLKQPKLTFDYGSPTISEESSTLKGLYYFFKELGIIDFLGSKVMYHKTSENQMPLSDNDAAMSKVVAKLMRLPDTKASTIRTYIRDSRNKGIEDYNESIRQEVEDLMKEVKISIM